MGFSLNKKHKVMSEINVTPLVDVMLVLLVIFMISAPLMLNKIDLDLPKTKKSMSSNLSKKQLVLSVDREGLTYLNEYQVKRSELIKKILGELEKTANKVIYLRADEKMAYGKVAKLITKLKNAGIIQIALVTEIEK